MDRFLEYLVSCRQAQYTAVSYCTDWRRGFQSNFRSHHLAIYFKQMHWNLIPSIYSGDDQMLPTFFSFNFFFCFCQLLVKAYSIVIRERILGIRAAWLSTIVHACLGQSSIIGLEMILLRYTPSVLYYLLHFSSKINQPATNIRERRQYFISNQFYYGKLMPLNEHGDDQIILSFSLSIICSNYLLRNRRNSTSSRW